VSAAPTCSPSPTISATWPGGGCQGSAIERATTGTRLRHISFDIDCIDAGFVPGTGWAEPGPAAARGPKLPELIVRMCGLRPQVVEVFFFSAPLRTSAT